MDTHERATIRGASRKNVAGETFLACGVASKEGRTEHIRNITLEGTHNDNKMERLNGEIRDREKVMRSLKKDDTPILAGMRIFHNYVRPHEGLEGCAPSELAGIQVEGENKWLTLIQNASKMCLRRLINE